MVDRSELASADVRQRWRIVFARDDEARLLDHVEAVKRWEQALRLADVPLALSQGRTPRTRLAFAAPLPVGMLAERDLVDLVLCRRLTVAELRDRLEGRLPDGYRLVDLFDVWVGVPTAASQLAAADYRALLRGATEAEIRGGCVRLLGAASLERARPKGEGRVIGYDLRPLLLGLDVLRQADGEEGAIGIRMRLRHAPDGGAGRPDEVVRALGEVVDRELGIGLLVRERLWTVDELGR